MADGSVEIRITGSVDPSVAASAQEAKAAIAGVGDASAATAATLRPGFDASAASLKQLIAQTGSFAAAQKALAAADGDMAAALAANAVATEADTVATAENTVATEANAAVHINSRAAYEATVLVHEILQGRYSRLTGSSMILTQQLAGQAAISKVLSAAMSAQGAAILGVVAVTGLAIAASISYDHAQEHLQETVAGLGAKTGLTAEQLREAGEAASKWADQSVAESTRAAAAFDAAGVKSQADIEKLAGSVKTYAQVTGVKFADAQKTLAEAMKDPLKGAQDLHDQLGILNGDQIEQIQRLTELGEKDQAVAIIAQALKERTDELRAAGVGLTGTFSGLIDTVSNLWTGFGNLENKIAELIPYFGRLRVEAEQAQAAQAGVIANQAKLNEASAKGRAAFDNTPEGQAEAKRNELQGYLSSAKDALTVDTALVRQGKEKADVLDRDRQAIADYTHAVTTYLPEVEKKTKADALDVQIAAARHSHNKQLVADLTEQKALLQESGKIESDNDARALAKGSGDVAGAKTFAPKGGKGPSIVSDWEEQLHEAEIASGEFFQDQTEKELAFWQGKVALTKAGSKEWLDVQSKIYDAQKALARQDYDEHIADLNDRIEADRDNFKKLQADWQEKLDFIKSKFGEESTEYKDAHRQFEAEERQHQQQMLQAERDGERKQIEALKSHLSAEQQLRSTNAQTAENIIRDQADSSVLGEAAAAARIGVIHAQLAQQELADAEAAYEAEDALRQKDIARAEATYTQDSKQYKDAVAAKALADQQYYDQKHQLEARAYAQQIQDILALKSAYSNYVGSTVGATITGLDGMLSKTQNWRQAVAGVYSSLVLTFEGSLAKMVTKWVVEHVFMTAAQRAALAAQNAAHIASEATKTAATTTGVTTRAAVESTGFFARLLSLLGISVGHHVASETAKTSATVTGATTRAATEAATAATSKATQIASNVALVSSYSGVAGAAGTASFAAAPWPIDMGAPAFGASMAASALAFLPEASLATGTNYLGRDMVVQAHEGERIIPKADNAKLIQMMSMASGGIDGGGRPDVHLHYSPNIHERERLDMRSLLASGGGDMLAFLRQAVRDGKLKLQPA